jgi:hypothetical protein
MANPATDSISIKPAVDPNTGFVTVNVFDGARQPMPQGTQILLTVRDGAQNQLFRNFVSGPSVKLELPFHNNFADNYSIVAFVDGRDQAGFQPVAIGPNAPAQLDLMLLPKNGAFHFAGARWTDILAQKPLLGQIFAASVTGAAGDAYATLMETHPDRLACLLNITTAMQQISLPQKFAARLLQDFRSGRAGAGPDFRLCGRDVRRPGAAGGAAGRIRYGAGDRSHVARRRNKQFQTETVR